MHITNNKIINQIKQTIKNQNTQINNNPKQEYNKEINTHNKKQTPTTKQQ